MKSESDKLNMVSPMSSAAAASRGAERGCRWWTSRRSRVAL